MSKSSDKLASKLKELRISHGYKQADVAGALDIRQAAYSHYETGVRTPSPTILYKIANYYGMPVDDLLKLCIPLDEDVFYNAPDSGWFARDEEAFLDYTKKEDGVKLTTDEKTLLYHFSKLTMDSKKELIDFAVFKHYTDAGVIPGRK